MPDGGARHGERRGDDVARRVPRRGGLRRDREPAAYHLRIVDAAPQMPPVGHVTVLAVHALAGEPAGPPFLVGVLHELAVDGQARRFELVTATAELRALEGRGARDPAVRERGPRRRALERAVTPGRAEPLVAAHVTAGADDAACLQIRLEVGVGHPRALHAGERALLREWGVTRLAAERLRGIVPEQLHQLPGHAGAHGRRVQAGAPVGELDCVTGPAGLRRQGALQQRIAGWRRPLKRQRHPPVPRHELLDGIAGAGPGRSERDEGGGHGQHRRPVPSHAGQSSSGARDSVTP